MARRRLNRHQAWRIQKIQQERLARAQRRAEKLQELTQGAALGPEQTGTILSNYGASVELEGAEGERYRCMLRQNLETPVAGDEVVWQAGPERSGVVTALKPRRSLLARPDSRDEMKPLAANIDQIVIVAAPLPRYSTELIDQYLVAAEHTGITPAVLFNKMDLLDEEEREATELQMDLYRRIGYRVIFASTVANHGLDALLELLRDKTSIFAGQSGVGKSSLVNTLVPAGEARVSAISESGFGRHTTSAARLYHLPGGGRIIDSPGVREFRLWQIARQELAAGFREFRPFFGQCRFRNCRHENEPGCALQEAVEKGLVDEGRYRNFLHIAASGTEGVA